MNKLRSFLTNTTFNTNLNQDFEKNHSNNFCLTYLTNKISEGFNCGLLTGVILIDIQKAVDTIYHNILFLKMPSFKLLIGISHTNPVGNSM